MTNSSKDRITLYANKALLDLREQILIRDCKPRPADAASAAKIAAQDLLSLGVFVTASRDRS